MTFHQPFDLHYWFVNVFAGDMTIFLTIAFIAIAVIGGMFRMGGPLMGSIFALFVVMFALYLGNIYLIVIVIVALVLGWTLSRFFR